MVAKLVGFRKDITHITVSLVLSKARTKLERGEVSGGLMIDLSKALECIFLELFNEKLYAHSLD